MHLGTPALPLGCLIGEPGFCLRTRASQVAPDPSSAPQPQGRGHTLSYCDLHPTVTYVRVGSRSREPGPDLGPHPPTTPLRSGTVIIRRKLWLWFGGKLSSQILSEVCVDEARSIVASIAKLPDLLRQQSDSGTAEVVAFEKMLSGPIATRPPNVRFVPKADT